MSTVLIIGDTHCPSMKRGYLDFLKRTADVWQPDRIVHIGDLVDLCCYSFHQKPGSLMDPVREADAARKQIAKLVAEFPEADVMLGNHDALINRRAEEFGLDISTLKTFNQFWGLPDTWKVHDRYAKLMIQGVAYLHGDMGKGGSFPALSQSKELFCSVTQGHHHAAFGVQYHANETSRVFGLQVGCGVDHKRAEMSYGRKFNKKPILGCGIVEEGKAGYAIPWTLKSRN